MFSAEIERVRERLAEVARRGVVERAAA